jgi:long-chain acyl-CoA synthetase
MAALIPVPIYDSLGPNSAEYILTHSESSIVIVSPSKLGNLLIALKNCPLLKTILLIGETAPTIEDNITIKTC